MLGKVNEEYIEKFDKVLIDVPCLGIGVIKRKPDIKWQRKKEDIEKITKIQFNILEKCANYLKVGGKMVYSTCSILKSENEDIVEKWFKKVKTEECKNNKKYEIESIEKILPDEETDGFFICKIRRVQ